jgi:hypothetical protein
MHYDLVLATPGSWMNASYVRSLTRTIKALEDEGITWTFVNYESSYIRGARERVITDSYDSDGLYGDISDTTPFSGNFDYSKILWIDSDIQWEPENVLALYHSERDIVTGAYMMTNGQVAVSFGGWDHPFPRQIPDAREVEVSTCGFGFLCVKKGVFEKMPRPWFDSVIFEVDGMSTTMLGEDNSWCIRAREAGFKIWLDPKVRVIHNKVMALSWDGLTP